jgi:signal transduction histidine kinase
VNTHSSVSARWDRTVLCVSAGVMLIGLTVLVGWHAHILVAVQIVHGMIPMQYNTALCFLALGIAGIGLRLRKRLWVVCGGMVAAGMGAAVVLEYATGTSLGIDTLFFYPWVRTLSADAGRMAISTAICFCLTGTALVILGVRPRAYAAFGIVNSVPLSLALTSLIGYAFQITYVLPFSLGSQMALLSSTAFLAYGIAMLGHAWMQAERGPDGLPKWGAGIGVALLPVLLVGASAFFPEQSWRVAPFEALFAIVGVALITLAVLGLTTAKVAFKGLLMIAVPLILLLSFVGLVVRVKHQSETAQVLALHSTEVIGASQSLLSHLAETESAVRGYVITGDATFVTSYEASFDLITRTTARLRTLVSDNPLQEARAGAIERWTAQRMEQLSGTITLMKDGYLRQAEEGIKGKTGLDLMQQVDTALGGFSQEEARLGAERRRNLDGSWQKLSWLLVSGTAAAILLASILMLLFSGGISRRLRGLRDNAIRLAAGKELAPVLTGRDEIAELDRVFHDMAASLDEGARREKQSGEDQMRFKDQFLSHVSHELRSPLTAIKQFTTILLGGLAGTLNAEQREYQEIVLKNVEQLQSMIDDLLEVTRLETGKLTVDLESVSVADAVSDAVHTLQVTALAKGVTVSSDVPRDLPNAQADPTRLRQILINLLDNALKFTPTGGAAGIHAGLSPQDSQFLLLEVSDTGCGVNPEMAERIFDRLYQASEYTQPSRKGMGLGLYICKELVTRQGGNIWVTSRLPKGSVFSFTLPVTATRLDASIPSPIPLEAVAHG